MKTSTVPFVSALDDSYFMLHPSENGDYELGSQRSLAEAEF